MARNRMTILPAGIAEPLSAAEQAHMDSGGAAALAAAAPPADMPSESPADASSAPQPAPVAPPSRPASEPVASEPEPAAPERDVKSTMVPHAALHEERERRKEAEKKASLLEERTNLLIQAMQQSASEAAQPAPEPIPPYDKDPEGHVAGMVRAQSQVLQSLVAREQERQQVEQHQAAERRFASHAMSQEQAFVATTPDYATASQFLIAARHQDLETLGYHDPAEREALIAKDARAIAARALQARMNPAQLVYAMAQQRGYKSAGTPAPAAARPSAAGAERIRTVAAGQRQGTSLAGVRGTGPQPLTAQRLLEMSDADFARSIATPEGRALLGA